MKLKTILCIAGFLLAVLTKLNAQATHHDSLRVHIVENENGVLTDIDTVVAASQHDQLMNWLSSRGIDMPATPPGPDADSVQVEVMKVITDDVSGDSSHQMRVNVINDDGTPVNGQKMKIILLPDDPKAPSLPPLPPAPPAAPGMKSKVIPPDAPEPENNQDVQIIIVKDSAGVQHRMVTKTVVVNNSAAAPKTPATPEISVTEKKSPEAKDLTIYPNPSNGHITLNMDMPGKGKTDIRVTDANGKTVYSESLGESEGKISKEIDLSKNGKGMYNVEVRKAGNVVVERVVIQ